MSENKPAFEWIWETCILPAMNLCAKELDSNFEKKANVTPYDLNAYKNRISNIYKKKREWLKREYLPNEKDPVLDFHKLSAIMCRSVIGLKYFSYDIRVAEEFFLKMNQTDFSYSQLEKVNWQINNVYVNYKLAFLVAEGIVFADLIYWAQCKINEIKENCAQGNLNRNRVYNDNVLWIYRDFIEELNNEKRRLLQYEESSSHDSFMVSSIIALMKNDQLKRDFDYLQFAISMFQWQQYTKKQLIYEILKKNNVIMDISELM